jgi:peptidoglycan L-alanyl-D-glutamate endopeptidase CwlK
MSYKLGTASLAELSGVHPDVVRVVKRAIELTAQDFTVFDGARTLAEQKRYKAEGRSKTLNSRHLVQADGFGHAVDLPAWMGTPVWAWSWDEVPAKLRDPRGRAAPVFEIAWAVAQAARDCGVRIVWGGVWDRVLNDYGTSVQALEKEVEAYKVRHKGTDFLDGPHFELAKKGQ